MYTRDGSKKSIFLGGNSLDVDMHDLNAFRTISNLDKIKSFSEVYNRFSDQLNIKEESVRWDLILGKEKCNDYERGLLKDIKFTINRITTYHTEILKERIKLYENLTQIKDGEGNLIEKPVYSHAGVTGRTTIKSGFNYLTSKKEFRKKCSSTKENSFLVGIDFKACEPNLYLRSIGREVNEDDVYEYLAKNLKIKVKDRSTLKRGILSVLYGASDITSTRLLGSSKDDLNKIKKFFEIEAVEEELKNTFKETGTIYNMYGRPIYSDKSILNKWIQSSAVDFCSLAFLKFIRVHDLSVCYLVHDEMVVEVDDKKFEEIRKVKNISDPISNLSLPVEITKISI
jgi:hypothetical protein